MTWCAIPETAATAPLATVARVRAARTPTLAVSDVTTGGTSTRSVADLIADPPSRSFGDLDHGPHARRVMAGVVAADHILVRPVECNEQFAAPERRDVDPIP